MRNIPIFAVAPAGLLLALVAFCGCAGVAAQQTGSIWPRGMAGGKELFDEACSRDDECAPLPELWPACSHYCAEASARSARTDDPPCPAGTALCVAFSRINGDVGKLRCLINAPCVRPVEVFCDRGSCATR